MPNNLGVIFYGFKSSNEHWVLLTPENQELCEFLNCNTNFNNFIKNRPRQVFYIFDNVFKTTIFISCSQQMATLRMLVANFLKKTAKKSAFPKTKVNFYVSKLFYQNNTYTGRFFLIFDKVFKKKFFSVFHHFSHLYGGKTLIPKKLSFCDCFFFSKEAVNKKGPKLRIFVLRTLTSILPNLKNFIKNWPRQILYNFDVVFKTTIFVCFPQKIAKNFLQKKGTFLPANRFIKNWPRQAFYILIKFSKNNYCIFCIIL